MISLVSFIYLPREWVIIISPLSHLLISLESYKKYYEYYGY